MFQVPYLFTIQGTFVEYFHFLLLLLSAALHSFNNFSNYFHCRIRYFSSKKMLLVTCNHLERVVGGDRAVTEERGCCVKAEVAAFLINLVYEQSDKHRYTISEKWLILATLIVLSLTPAHTVWKWFYDYDVRSSFYVTVFVFATASTGGSVFALAKPLPNIRITQFSWKLEIFNSTH